MHTKWLNFGFTKRKGDKIALVAIAILLVLQLIQVVYSIGYMNNGIEGRFVFKPELIIWALILYVPAFIIAYGGLIFYLIRDKETFPRRPMYYSKNKVVATVFTAIYYSVLLLFFLLSLLIGPDKYDDSYLGGAASIVIGALITIVLGLPVNIVGYFLWIKNYGRTKDL